MIGVYVIQSYKMWSYPLFRLDLILNHTGLDLGHLEPSLCSTPSILHLTLSALLVHMPCILRNRPID